MASQNLIEFVDSFEPYLEKCRGKVDDKLIESCLDACQVAYREELDIEYGLKVSNLSKYYIEKAIKQSQDADGAYYEDFFDLDYTVNNAGAVSYLTDSYYSVLKHEAPFIFDSYMLYLEKERPNERRFYANRVKTFRKFNITQSLQDLEDDKLDILSISLPPSTGKTAAECFFASWVCGRHIADYSLFFTHSSEMADIFYRSIVDIATSDEYLFNSIFPDCIIQSTDAKAKRVNFGNYKPYANVQCTSVGSQNAGKVRTNRYLYCDDLVSSIEEALNKAQLDKLWRIYTSDARQRKKNQQVKEIHIATRWSVHDVIGRLKETYADNDRARFIAVPDIDPQTNESNFNYRHEGMSTAFFNDIALTMDEVTYKCLYKNEPIEREGLLYHDNELRRYSSLPDGEPDAILGICDTKTTGTDYMFLPCFYQYGDDYYLDDCVCDNGVYSDLYPKMTDVIIENNMQSCEFESNAGGTQIADEVEKRINEYGGRCIITRKPTETNKETRILASAPWIVRHILFKDKETYAPRSDYGVMMNLLLTYSVAGKNKHDDIPDGLSNFYNMVTSRKPKKKARIIKSPL